MKEKLRLVKILLEKRKVRREQELFVVEGPHLVEEAAESIDFVVYAEQLPQLAILEDRGIDCFKVSKKEFSEISEVETPQWILAVVKQQKFSLEDILKVQNPLIVCCVEVQDPGNLGTIIRTADAVGADGVILSRGTVDLYNGKVIRSTMGSMFHLPIVEADDLIDTIEILKQKNVRIISADTDGQIDYFAADYREPVAILVGNEGAGLSKGVLDLSDQVVKIPMPGKAESLNVGISTALMLYEALRQRTYAGQS